MADHAAEETGFHFSNAAYDTVKAIAQYVLPALGTFYFALAEIWGLPYAAQIIGTITAFDIFLGVILGLSKKAYDQRDGPFDGELAVDNDGALTGLVIDKTVEELQGKNSLTLKVNTATPE